MITSECDDKVQIVGDDLLATNPTAISKKKRKRSTKSSEGILGEFETQRTKKKKKKKVNMPNAEMQWRASQDFAAENYMMPPGHL
ncbi:unnamed protein product [Lactuca virosa]|uniref:Enolase C-terminal TIM barrel domain-containing protein n=1 Tax=Lactuca virosa TaxID=75947 RepID=A0AAU9LQ81_9ASTR|nr:unnamed protein product [Lactuca virosa]